MMLDNLPIGADAIRLLREAMPGCEDIEIVAACVCAVATRLDGATLNEQEIRLLRAFLGGWADGARGAPR